jgi:hypothetical protein
MDIYTAHCGADKPDGPYPARNDAAGWERWWASWRAYYRWLGASADGIHDGDDPAPRLRTDILADMSRRLREGGAS